MILPYVRSTPSHCFQLYTRSQISVSYDTPTKYVRGDYVLYCKYYAGSHGTGPHPFIQMADLIEDHDNIYLIEGHVSCYQKKRQGEE